MGFRIRRQVPKVRPHASGAWTICIGKKLNADKSRLVPKDWYFRATENDANASASTIAKRWAHIVANWEFNYQPTLTALGLPFAEIPHWDQTLETARVMGPAEAEIEKFRNERPTREEIQEAYQSVTLDGVFGLFKLRISMDAAHNEKGMITVHTDMKNIRGALAFIGENLLVEDLDDAILLDAKSRMLAKLSPRTASNYLEATKRMLVWFYQSDYGRGHEKSSEFDKAFSIARNRTKAKIKSYSVVELKTLLDATKTDEQRLFIILALNCGMYQADIGRLTLEEFSLSQGYVYWDREKEPQNNFRVRHDLWPETIKLVKRLIQSRATFQRFYTDYRNYKPIQIDCSCLAFVNAAGEPIYRVRPSGKEYSVISKAFAKIDAKDSDGNSFQFHNLRKSTNTIMKNSLRNVVNENDPGKLVAVEEISDTFLSHSTPELVRVYEVRGTEGYGLMNHYLKSVGKMLRSSAVFESIK